MLNFAGAYSAVAGDNLRNFRHWHNAQQALVSALRTRLQMLGVHTSAWAEAHLFSRLELPGPSTDPVLHLRLWKAMFTDATSTFWTQFPYRHDHAGNVHLDIVGGTGLGKSSQGGTILVTVREQLTGERLPPERLLEHMGIDASDKPDKLPRLRPGDVYQDDDETEVAGEGANTALKIARNTAAMLRASQVSLIRISPELDAHSTTQGRLEAIMVHDNKWTLNIFWVGGHPIGLVGIDWMPPEYYAVYAPWKAANTERVLKAQFGDSRALAKLCMKVCEDWRFITYMTKLQGKPKLKDFKTALTLFQPQMMAASTHEKLADFMHDLAYGLERLGETDFERMFGMPVGKGLKSIADKCFEKGG